jgi:hypothetical protein
VKRLDLKKELPSCKDTASWRSEILHIAVVKI